MVGHSEGAELCRFLEQGLPINYVDDELRAKNSESSFTKEGKHNVAADSVGYDDSVMGVTLNSTLMALEQPASENSKYAAFGSFQTRGHGPYRASGCRGPVDK